MRKDESFVRINASQLSARSKMMKYDPQSIQEYVLKEELKKAIRKGLSDFFVSIYDPSINDRTGKIEFRPNRLPAMGKNYDEWVMLGKSFMPERKSQLAAKKHFVSFWGCFMKRMIDEGYPIEDAWRITCTDSRTLGNVWQCSSMCPCTIELTGSREAFGFYDLGNVRKVFSEDLDEKPELNLSGGFFLGGAAYYEKDGVASLHHVYGKHFPINNATGMIILNE